MREMILLVDNAWGCNVTNEIYSYLLHGYHDFHMNLHHPRDEEEISTMYMQPYVIDLFILMVFSATFNNILVISWLSVLLVEENGGPGENHYVADGCNHIYM
jgi:hypothetical protein